MNTLKALLYLWKRKQEGCTANAMHPSCFCFFLTKSKGQILVNKRNIAFFPYILWVPQIPSTRFYKSRLQVFPFRQQLPLFFYIQHITITWYPWRANHQAVYRLTKAVPPVTNIFCILFAALSAPQMVPMSTQIEKTILPLLPGLISLT